MSNLWSDYVNQTYHHQKMPTVYTLSFMVQACLCLPATLSLVYCSLPGTCADTESEYQVSRRFVDVKPPPAWLSQFPVRTNLDPVKKPLLPLSPATEDDIIKDGTG